MSTKIWTTVVLTIGLMTQAIAQAPAAASAPDAAMQRAMRDANNPLKRIQEAAKIERTKAAERKANADSADEPADGARRAASPTEAAPRPVTVPDTGIRVTVVPIQPPALPAPVNRTSPPVAEVQAAAPPPAPPAAPPAAQAGASNAQGLPREIEVPATVVAAAPMTAKPEVIKLPEVVTPPKAPVLVSMVEPVLTLQLMDRLPAGQTLNVRLTIQPDGAVREVDVQPPTSSQLARPIRAALLQWRFDSAPTERRHEVQLVFK